MSDKIGDRWSDTIRELSGAQAEIQQLGTQLAGARAFIRRCANHMICGSDMADTPLPTDAEWRDACQFGQSALDAAIAAATKPLVDALHQLAMLALQSQRYTDDLDYRDATDNAIALSQASALAQLK